MQTIRLYKLLEIRPTDTLMGLDDYPIPKKDDGTPDDDFRETLNGLIKCHYWTREIAFETDTLFVLKLRCRMHEIMPKYINFLERNRDLDYTISNAAVITSTTNSHSTSTSESENDTQSNATETGSSDGQSTGRVLYSDTPQTQLSGLEDYANNITDNRADSTESSTSESDGTSHATGTATTEADGDITAKQSTEVYDYNRFLGLSGIPSVYQMIISELDDLFLRVYITSFDYGWSHCCDDAGESLAYV